MQGRRQGERKTSNPCWWYTMGIPSGIPLGSTWDLETGARSGRGWNLAVRPQGSLAATHYPGATAGQANPDARSTAADGTALRRCRRDDPVRALDGAVRYGRHMAFPAAHHGAVRQSAVPDKRALAPDAVLEAPRVGRARRGTRRSTKRPPTRKPSMPATTIAAAPTTPRLPLKRPRPASRRSVEQAAPHRAEPAALAQNERFAVAARQLG
jgi:hypothetical protein